MNPDVDDVVDRPDYEEIDDTQDDVDEVVVLDHHRSGTLILTPMATYTGVGRVLQDENVEVAAIQDDEDDENDEIEYLEDEFEVVDVL